MSLPAAPTLAKSRSLALPPKSEIPTVIAKTVGLHPLLYRKRIERVDRSARAGDLVAVRDVDGKFAGYGLYNPRAEIALRMLRLGDVPPDESFWQEQLAAAVQLRKDVLKLDDVTNCYRVIHAEADGLPGLVVDRYGDVLSAEAFSVGMHQRAEAILQLLAPMCGTKHWLVQCGPATMAQEGFEAPPFGSEGLPSRVTVTEHGTRFRIDFTAGHKTGFFCDQRDNRLQLAKYCEGKTVLDLCCYTGGFSVQAKKLGNAKEVTGVDLDAAPLELAKENANLNQSRVRFVQADAFAYMRDMLAGGRKFDVVVLDPPKLVRNRQELDDGMRKHFDLNRLAMQLVAPGGLMLTCTCAGLVSRDEFLKLVYAAARQGGPQKEDTGDGRRSTPRTCQVLATSGAAPDHPIATQCPETEYLQAAWLRLL